MKKLGLALAALMSLTVLAPVTAEAGGCRTRVTYEPCGTRITWEYRYVGRDCHGCPVYRWVAVSRCAPERPRYDDYYGGGRYQGGGYYGGSCESSYSSRWPRYTYPGGSCGSGRSGISFYFGR